MNAEVRTVFTSAFCIPTSDLASLHSRHGLPDGRSVHHGDDEEYRAAEYVPDREEFGVHGRENRTGEEATG